MTPNYDLITDGILYTLGAVFAYAIFGMSQLFRMQYIEYMATSATRLVNKFFEYSSLLMTGMTLLFISDYHGIFYYIGDYF